MKMISKIILALFLVQCTNFENAQSNNQMVEPIVLNGEILNGRIKSIHERRIYTNKTDSLVYFFNELGLLISQKSSLFAGLNTKAVYTYNSDNQRIKTTMYDKDGKETDYIEFTYENGKLVRRFYKHAKSTRQITRYVDYQILVYKYDENGNIIEHKEIFKNKGSREFISKHIKYQYDSIGNRIIEEKLDRSGNVWERKKNEYLNGLLIETFTWQSFEGEDLYIRDTYEYHEDGTMKSHTRIVYAYGGTDEVENKKVKNFSFEYEHDKEGRLIKEVKRTTTTFSGIWHQPTTNTTVETRTYQIFDDKGNWRRKIEGRVIFERKIEYY